MTGPGLSSRSFAACRSYFCRIVLDKITLDWIPLSMLGLIMFCLPISYGGKLGVYTSIQVFWFSTYTWVIEPYWHSTLKQISLSKSSSSLWSSVFVEMFLPPSGYQSQWYYQEN